MSERSKTGETIYKTINELFEANRTVTRQVIAEETGLKLGVVDDHIKRGIDTGRLRRVVQGVIEPVDPRVDRAVSVTYLPKGGCKVEIGDDLLADISLREARMLSMGLAGVLLVFGRDPWAKQSEGEPATTGSTKPSSETRKKRSSARKGSTAPAAAC